MDEYDTRARTTRLDLGQAKLNGGFLSFICCPALMTSRVLELPARVLCEYCSLSLRNVNHGAKWRHC